MTAAELLDALRAANVNARANPDDGEGITVTEMADSANLSADQIRRHLRPMLKAGKVRVAKKRMVGMDGTYRTVASYVLIEETKAPKGKRAA